MRRLTLALALAGLPLFAHLAAEDAAADAAATTAAVSVDDRIAALEAEVAALRAQLDPEALAAAIAEQVVAAQIKAQQTPTTSEAVAYLAESHELDDATQTALVALLDSHATRVDDFRSQLMSGNISRDNARSEMMAMRDEHQAALGELLTEAQISDLREAQRPPASRGTNRGWGNRGWGGGNRQNGNRGNRGDGGQQGGQQGGNRRGNDGEAQF